MEGRIYFPGNPWPEGHPLKELVWSGRLDVERGLVFDLHLESEDYDSEREVEYRATDDDYKAANVWGNYHACILSSTYWNDTGWVVGTRESPLSFADLPGRNFIVDSLAKPRFDVHDLDDRSFHIYLLGHDDVADHNIIFSREGDAWRLNWQGRIALAYAGLYDFDHSFKLEATGLTFAGFEIGSDISDETARSLLTECCRDAEGFTLVTDGEERRFSFRT